VSLYAGLFLRESINVSVLGLSQKVELSFADGMVGAIPVFKDKATAAAYMGGRTSLILKINEIEKLEQGNE